MWSNLPGDLGSHGVLALALKCDAPSAPSPSNGVAEVHPAKERAQLPLHRNYFRAVAFAYVLPGAALVRL